MSDQCIRRTWLGWIVTLAAASSFGIPQVNKSVSVVPKDGPLKGQSVYTDSYALFVGIGTYQNPRIPHIPPAPNDAQTMCDLLVSKYGFNRRHAQVLTDLAATKDNIEKALDRLADTNVVKPTDRVFVYFSCHGQGLTLQDGEGVGYVIPYDANIEFGDIANPSGYQSSCLDMEEIVKRLKGCPAKHRTVVVDACFSGFAVGTKALTGTTFSSDALKRMLDLSGLFVMTAGGEHQEAAADGNAAGLSLFTRALVDTLNEGTINGGTFTVSQLAAEAAAKTISRSDGKQTPQFGEKAGSGQMLLFSATSSPPPGNSAELYSEAFRLDKAGDYFPAAKLYQEAADAGDADTMDGLGFMYENGRGALPQDDAEAVKWFRKAADGGSTRGMKDIAYMYTTGRGGLVKDDVEARKWYQKAANGGNAIGMGNLGLMYENGRGGLAKDEVEAMKWYRKAADGGGSFGMSLLGLMYENGRGGLAKDEVEAVKWYRKAAEAGDPSGMVYLASSYEDGLGGLPKDEAEAMKWYRKAAEGGQQAGMAKLGVAYEKGLGGIPKDDAQALKWFRKAAKEGNSGAMFNLGVLYYQGLGGLSKDDVEAVNWFRKAADGGDSDGMANLGAMYFNGQGGLPKDDIEAVKWFRKAADGGAAQGMTSLGTMYENGRGGLRQDRSEAILWYRTAAKLGNQDAKDNLKRLGVSEDG